MVKVGHKKLLEVYSVGDKKKVVMKPTHTSRTEKGTLILHGVAPSGRKVARAISKKDEHHLISGGRDYPYPPMTLYHANGEPIQPQMTEVQRQREIFRIEAQRQREAQRLEREALERERAAIIAEMNREFEQANGQTWDDFRNEIRNLRTGTGVKRAKHKTK